MMADYKIKGYVNGTFQCLFKVAEVLSLVKVNSLPLKTMFHVEFEIMKSVRKVLEHLRFFSLPMHQIPHIPKTLM